MVRNILLLLLFSTLCVTMKGGRRGQQPVKQNPHRINGEIRGVREVELFKLVGEYIDNESLQSMGIVTIQEALAAAEEADLDLVEVSPNAEPPVCYIMDYAKFLAGDYNPRHRHQDNGGADAYSADDYDDIFNFFSFLSDDIETEIGASTLTKAELAENIFDKLGFSKRDAKEFVETFFEEIIKALESKETVKLSGFGNFELRYSQERPGRNPKTGADTPLTDRVIITFRPGQKLKTRVQNGGRPSEIDVGSYQYGEMENEFAVGMTKSELIERLWAEHKQSLETREVEDAVAEILEQMSSTLEVNGRVEIRGFGSFSLQPRVGRNPKTGDKVELKGKFVPYFKAAKAFRERVNKDNADIETEIGSQGESSFTNMWMGVLLCLGSGVAGFYLGNMRNAKNINVNYEELEMQ